MDIPSGFEGELIAAGMPGYDEARRVFDRRADKRPGAILRCRSVEDVRAALRFARDRRSPIAVRSGGHGFTGRSTIDDGVLIDLSAMDGVILDADRRTVRIEPGARTGRVLRATVPAGLAPVTCAGNDIGVVGAALFAGQGYLSPRHGNMCDNVLSFDLLLADGRMIRVSRDEHPDLFWAMRGAGDNFGIVVAAEMRVHAVPPLIHACAIEYDGRDAAAAMRLYRDHRWASPLPWLLGSLFLDAVGGEPRLSYLFALTGSEEEARRDLDALDRSVKPRASNVDRMDWVGLHDCLAFPPDIRFHIAQRELHALDETSIALMLDELPRLAADPDRPTPVDGEPAAMILFYPTDAAMGRPADPPNAYSLRGGYDLEAVALWRDPARDAHHAGWAEGAIDRFVASGLATRASVLANSFVDEALSRNCFAGDYARLAALKRVYDPDGLFGSTAIIRSA